MQIISIKASKLPNRVWINFSDNSFLPFFIDDIVKLSLVKNQEIDQSKLDLITKTALQFVGREYALRQIAISPKVEKIIYQKLKIFFQKFFLKYKISYQNINEIIQEIIDYLNSKNLLSEKKFIEYFIQKNKTKSSRQISYLLSQFNIKTQIQNNDLEIIKKIILKKKNIDKLKLKSSLYRRGFNLSDINNAFDGEVNFR
ncbi:MAG: RecX family transcriptional regulator [Candidatus Shapirobacteria bacterium]|nr:RecX family transcriptional regulator [Candidatus Shapirobacteria bacterium]